MEEDIKTIHQLLCFMGHPVYILTIKLPGPVLPLGFYNVAQDDEPLQS